MRSRIHFLHHLSPQNDSQQPLRNYVIWRYYQRNLLLLISVNQYSTIPRKYEVYPILIW